MIEDMALAQGIVLQHAHLGQEGTRCYSVLVRGDQLLLLTFPSPPPLVPLISSSLPHLPILISLPCSPHLVPSPSCPQRLLSPSPRPMPVPNPQRNGLSCGGQACPAHHVPRSPSGAPSSMTHGTKSFPCCAASSRTPTSRCVVGWRGPLAGCSWQEENSHLTHANAGRFVRAKTDCHPLPSFCRCAQQPLVICSAAW